MSSTTKIKAATTSLLDALKTGPKTMQQLYQELPQLTHSQIKRKLVRPLTKSEVTEVKMNRENKTFYINLRTDTPTRFDEIIEATEKALQPKKLNIKWDFQSKKRFTKDIGKPLS